MSRYPEIRPEVVRAVEADMAPLIVAPRYKEVMQKHGISRASLFRIVRNARKRFHVEPISVPLKQESQSREK